MLITIFPVSFYIRSKSNPNNFWVEEGGSIYSSKQNPTKSRVSNGKNRHREKKIIIADDSITITAYVGDNLQECVVQVGDDGSLFTDLPQAASGGLVNKGHVFRRGRTEFKFSDFKNGFLPVGKESEHADAKIMSVLIYSWHTAYCIVENLRKNNRASITNLFKEDLTRFNFLLDFLSSLVPPERNMKLDFRDWGYLNKATILVNTSSM